MDFPPGLLPNREKILEDLLACECSAEAVEIARRCRRTATAPSAGEIAQDLRRLAAVPQPPDKASRADRGWCASAALQAARRTDDYAVVKEEGICWRNDHFLRSFECEAINIGTAGIMIGLAAIGTSLKTDEFEPRILAAGSWLVRGTPKGKSAGLFTGNAGVALALALVLTGRRCGADEFVHAARRRFEHAALSAALFVMQILPSSAYRGEIVSAREHVVGGFARAERRGCSHCGFFNDIGPEVSDEDAL